MKPAAVDITDKIIALSRQLPEEQRRQLLKLLSGWKTNARQSTRETYTERLKFTSKNGTNYGYARDVSTTGILIATSAAVELGESITLTMTFISAPNPIRLHGKVVRKTGEGIGIHFDKASRTQVKELDSIISKHALILSPSPRS